MNPLILANLYTYYTLCASFHYRQAWGNQLNAPNPKPIALRRAYWYDTKAITALNQLNEKQQEIAKNWYHNAYKAGRSALELDPNPYPKL